MILELSQGFLVGTSIVVMLARLVRSDPLILHVYTPRPHKLLGEISREVNSSWI